MLRFDTSHAFNVCNELVYVGTLYNGWTISIHNNVPCKNNYARIIYCALLPELLVLILTKLRFGRYVLSCRRSGQKFIKLDELWKAAESKYCAGFQHCHLALGLKISTFRDNNFSWQLLGSGVGWSNSTSTVLLCFGIKVTRASEMAKSGQRMWGNIAWWFIVCVSVPFGMYTLPFIYGKFELYKDFTVSAARGDHHLAGLHVLNNLRTWQVGPWTHSFCSWGLPWNKNMQMCNVNTFPVLKFPGDMT